MLESATLTPQQRLGNDRHRLWVVGLVLGGLGLLTYLLTDVSRMLGLPTPQELLAGRVQHVDFRKGSGALDIVIDLAFTHGPDTRPLAILLGFIALAFLGGYLAPMAWKKACHVVCGLATILLIYGPIVAGGLLAGHLLIFVSLHPSPRKGLWAGLAVAMLSLELSWGSPLLRGLLALGAGSVGFAAYGTLLLPLLRSRAGPAVRTLLVQSPLITVVVGAAVQGLGGAQWSLPLGLLMFFWQWERLIFYHIDYKAGAIPSDIPLVEYFAVFLTPAVIAKWEWGATLGQGYGYLQSGFYAEDKNRLALSGLKLWGLALLYALFGDWLRLAVAQQFESFGVHAYDGRIRAMVDVYMAGGHVTTASVLVTTWLDIFRWMALWAGCVHFKVGVWRVLGYRVAPYFDKPFLATNLVDLWTRYTFHYREFISQAFYYPAFFKAPRFIRRNLKVRVVVATFVAATYGNIVWGHIPEGGFYHGLIWAELLKVLSSWPYFVLLSLLISGTELYLMTAGSRRRRPWTGGPWILWDVVCVYFCVQAYGLIHIFNRTTTLQTLPKLARLFLVGLGFSS